MRLKSPELNKASVSPSSNSVFYSWKSHISCCFKELLSMYCASPMLLIMDVTYSPWLREFRKGSLLFWAMCPMGGKNHTPGQRCKSFQLFLFRILKIACVRGESGRGAWCGAHDYVCAWGEPGLGQTLCVCMKHVIRWWGIPVKQDLWLSSWVILFNGSGDVNFLNQRRLDTYTQH